MSGYYSDRPDFQRLLRDIEMGKVKAVVCSNNINTQISTSKIIIQVLAIIAESDLLCGRRVFLSLLSGA